VITGSSGAGNFAIIDGFQLSPAPTPEPASFILGGLGTIGLFITARRRRRA
jgi:PEP-CTERM motif-containing protein